MQVGQLDNRPIMISLSFVEIEEKVVAFWYAMSEVVDYAQIKVWLAQHFDKTYNGGRPATSNAQNFHHCLQAIAESKEHGKESHGGSTAQVEEEGQC